MSTSQHLMSLRTAPVGKWLRIHSLPHGFIHAQFIRLGISEGERVKSLERLPGGTIVLQKNRQHIAIGHTLAKQIFVLVLQQDEVAA